MELMDASAARVLASCLVTCGVVWGLGWWLRRSLPQWSNRRQQLRVVEGLPLGGGRYLLLVKCGERQMLLALTPQHGVQLLADFPASEPEEAAQLKGRNGDVQTDERAPKDNVRHNSRWVWSSWLPLLTLLVILLVGAVAAAQSPTASAVRSQLSVGREAVQILLVLTLIALAPFLLSVMTCFTRIVIVLSLLRMALGTPQTPPNPVVIGMALFLTLFVMAPTLQEANEKGLRPFLQGHLSVERAVAEGYRPFQRFMLRQVREQDIALFLRIARLPNPQRPEDVPAHILVPAFILSEVRTGFEIGFLLSVPFLVVDVVIASVLMGLGMLMVPPMLISLPLKLLLFVLADGWHLLMRGLALSVR
ncbi:Flagellar biosynthetic protein FliP [bacterium HR17]|jgi:flagellar biosynthetic protein FliP|uniref:Flagellar biosynthetic protein FliP n=1 Tax=Candidatus Fervidibacter japonicus TaxID=2035412 RepID=A0A2H5XCW3_9BACT|nr:Flagellar biosynthetic protein FliP [bacterium HR17]